MSESADREVRLGRPRNIVLDEETGDAVRCVTLRLKCFEKEPALVAKDLRFDDNYFRNLHGNDVRPNAVGRNFPASFAVLLMDDALSEMTESWAELIECSSSAATPPPFRLYDSVTSMIRMGVPSRSRHAVQNL